MRYNESTHAGNAYIAGETAEEEWNMSKIGKTLFAVTAIGAIAAAGAYYYLQKKDENVPENMDDDVDFDSFDADVDDDTAAAKQSKRSYVNLDFNTVEEKAKDVVSKVADAAQKASGSIGNFVTQAEGKVEEFFNDKKEAASDAVDEAADAVAAAGEAAEDAVEEAADAVSDAIEE